MKKEIEKFEKYIDPNDDFSNKELKWAEWYLKHKLSFRKATLFFLISFCVLTVGFSLSYLGYYFSYGYFQDQKMYALQTTEFQNYEAIKDLYTAKDLQVNTIEMYNSVSNKYDFVARVINPNPRWIASVSYKFTFDGGETATEKTVLWPNSTRPIISFGNDPETYPSSLKLVIEDVAWQKIKESELRDVESFIIDHSSFETANFNFTPASRVADILNHLIEFDLANNTIYSFWEPKFYVELKDSSGMTNGFIYLVLDQFKTTEERHISLRSFVDNLDVSDIVVWPAFDIFSRSEYMLGR